MNRNPICKNHKSDHNISQSSRGFGLIATEHHSLPDALINQFRCTAVLDTRLISDKWNRNTFKKPTCTVGSSGRGSLPALCPMFLQNPSSFLQQTFC